MHHPNANPVRLPSLKVYNLAHPPTENVRVSLYHLFLKILVDAAVPCPCCGVRGIRQSSRLAEDLKSLEGSRKSWYAHRHPNEVHQPYHFVPAPRRFKPFSQSLETLWQKVPKVPTQAL